MKTVQHVENMLRKASRLPEQMAELNHGGQILSADGLSRRAEKIKAFFAPVLDTIDWQAGAKGMDPSYAKAYAETAKVAAAYTMATHMRESGIRQMTQEAATAGVDLPTFTRQLLMTIVRAYPRLFTLQLFGVMPIPQPTARVHFKDYLYDSTFVGSAPNISAGDRTDDTTKFNPDYYLAPEGQLANKLRETFKFMTVTAQDYRVVSEWTDSYADDAQSVYDDNVDASQAAHRAQEMARVVDRRMVAALITATPAANKYTWTAQPTNNPNYVTMTPSEKLAYDEGIYRDGILNTLNKVRVARKLQDDGECDWCLCGTDFALAIERLSMFKPVRRSAAELEGLKGALRDLGQMEAMGIRFLVDPLLSISGSTNVAFFGHKPMARGDVGLWWLPYINVQPTRDFYDPNTGTTTKAVRSRFAIAQPDNTVPQSAQIGDVYGQLTVA